MNGPGQVSGTRGVLLTVVIVVAVLRLAQDVFIPLALAILLTFLLAPLVARLTDWGVNRLLAVIVSLAIALALIGTLATWLSISSPISRMTFLPSNANCLHTWRLSRAAWSGGVRKSATRVDQLSG